ncbi:MAG: peptidase M20 [Bacteroidetes bacterium QS_7_67_15]|nr:MAG: peptidase M20 [Bacteroidetes bacterium QS_7_67_15]
MSRAWGGLPGLRTPALPPPKAQYVRSHVFQQPPPPTDVASDHDAIALLKELVAYPSLSGEEGPVADFVEAHVRAAGLPVEVGRVDDNVYVSLGDGSGDDDRDAQRLLLCSHLDVVPPSSDHPYDPFTPTETDGRLYGRGAVDAKASGAAMTTALLSLARAGWTPGHAGSAGQLLVALTTHEETGGAYNGLQALRPHLPDLGAAVVGEPTSLKPCVAQKGLLILEVHARGQTAHAARAHLGDNAILRAARDIERLQSFSLDREDPFLGAPTINVTTIEGGSARNVISDRCTFTLDIRSTPAYTHDEIIDEIDALLESDVTVRSKRLVPASTDVPAVKLGPGESSRSHTAEEHIRLTEVERAAEVYAQLAKAYFA